MLRRFFDRFYFIRYELMVLGCLLALLLLLFAGWYGYSLLLKKPLERAESFIESDPARAQSILDSLPPHRWWHPERQARHALLHSIALDKRHIDIKSDSVIRPAAEFYRVQGAARYRMLTYYYLGRIHQNAENYPQAHAYFTFADQLADSLGELQSGGLIARGLTEINNHSNNFSEELRYAEKALRLFTEAGSALHAEWARYDLAQAHSNNRNYPEAIGCYEAFSEATKARKDTLTLGYSLADQAAAHLALGEFQRAKELLEEAHDRYHRPANAKWLADYAYACAGVGERHKALALIARAEELNEGADVQMRVWGRKAQVSAACGAYDEAYEVEQLLSEAVDSTIRRTLEESAVVSHHDYYKKESESISAQLRKRAGGLWRALLILALLSGLLIGWLLLRNRQRKVQIDEYMGQINTIRDNLAHQESTMSELGQKISQQLKGRFIPLNQLAETYYAHQKSPKEQQKIYASILKSLEEFSQPDYIRAELEPLINHSEREIVSRMREQLPNLNEKEVQLACYLLTGFSAIAISLFQQTTVENVYRRVYRLREKVKNSEAPDREEFIRKLS